MKKTEIILMRESFMESAASDAVTCGFLAGSVWFNESYCNGSVFMNAVILTLFLMFMFSRRKSKDRTFFSYEEAIMFLHAQSQKEDAK